MLLRFSFVIFSFSIPSLKGWGNEGQADQMVETVENNVRVLLPYEVAQPGEVGGAHDHGGGGRGRRRSSRGGGQRQGQG